MLDQFITKYSGKVLGDGQCGTLVRQYWIEVDKTSPPSYVNSKDYWSNPVPGYDKITSNPQPGDIAIYNGHGVYTAGHSAIYAGNGQVFEQNADPDGSAAHLYNRANTYLLGYLRKEGEEMWNNGDSQNYTNAYLGGGTPPSYVTAQEGTDFKTAAYNLMSEGNLEYSVRVNAGDQTNVNNVLGTSVAVRGLTWKEAWYNQISLNLPSGQAATTLKSGIYKVN